MAEDEYPEVVIIHRYFGRDELGVMTKWLIEQTGNNDFWDDCILKEQEDESVFFFKNPQLALHFKIRWDSGREVKS
jgi:hypothetical protein